MTGKKAIIIPTVEKPEVLGEAICPNCANKKAAITKESAGQTRVACKRCKKATWMQEPEDLNPFFDEAIMSEKDLTAAGFPTKANVEKWAQEAAGRLEQGKCKTCGGEDPIEGVDMCEACLQNRYGLSAEEFRAQMGNLLPGLAEEKERES